MLRRFKATDFRCLGEVEVELSPGFNLACGANASGKTSFLEALAYLGRGKSFRGAGLGDLLRHGQSEFVLFGELDRGATRLPLGVRNSRQGLEIRINGEPASGAAALAEALPLQVIDPEVHNLVAGGPEQRRRFVDWIAFHVEHNHLASWRRFRRALKQRNAVLRDGRPLRPGDAWNAQFVADAMALDESRRRALAAAGPALQRYGEALLGARLGFEYQPGWPVDAGLAQALESGHGREQQQGSTLYGPHRADLRIRYDERLARRLVSRGQQKLLASAMVLAATDTVQTRREQPLLLLLDDPAAELDASAVRRLLDAVVALDTQTVATALDPKALVVPPETAMFHVERGRVARCT